MGKPFIRNRAEEYGHDVWDTYVLPPYFESLGLDEARKSCVIEGGRGCGKTALLRYLSYQSQFSPDRKEIPDGALRTVGLYLKADAQYFSSFVGNGLDEKKWVHIFDHALCLSLADQVLSAVRALTCNSDRVDKYGGLEKLNFSAAVQGLVEGPLPGDLDSFEQWIRVQKQSLVKWFRNYDRDGPPSLLPMREFVGALIEEIRGKLPHMASSVFAVYVDEYENLLDYQQRFVNTLIKVGEPPLIFHVAMKPNGMRTRKTMGVESIQETADFRRLSLDDLLAPGFKLFAAELFFFRLIVEASVPESNTPIVLSQLRTAESLKHRKTDSEYGARVLGEIERILPGLRYSEIAQMVLSDSSLQARWRSIVEKGLKAQKSNVRPEAFLDAGFPEAAVVCAPLLHQRGKLADDILRELEKLRKAERSQFREGEWIHHLLVGALLLVYLPFRQRPCPLYAGFEAFTRLASTNVRHFLELCHVATEKYDPRQPLTRFSVSVEEQAIAAVKASAKFRSEVSSFGDHGNRLFALVNFLGRLFRLSQARLAQSEAERTHFSIVDEELTDEARIVITEAVKWSVLFETPETKVKSNRYEASDYIFNPIYAPFFGLSFNKGRKLELRSAEGQVMLTGKVDDLTKLLRSYENSWIGDSADQLDLGL